LRAKTVEFRARIARRSRHYGGRSAKTAEREALDEILAEGLWLSFAKRLRAVQMRHFDVQLIGGMVLTRAKIAEMRTGKKDMVATLSCY